MQISESQCGRAIRTEKYKYSVKSPAPTGYIHHSSKVYFEDYLYDLGNDPIEKHNLVKDANYKNVRKKLREMLISEMQKANEHTPIILPAIVKRNK
jgi:uncharacterized sulfatase